MLMYTVVLMIIGLADSIVQHYVQFNDLMINY